MEFSTDAGQHKISKFFNKTIDEKWIAYWNAFLSL